MSRVVSVLDRSGHLVGARVVEDGEALEASMVDIDPGDLDLDGTYKWNRESGRFEPLGTGFPRVSTRSPVSLEWVIARLVEAQRGELPSECGAWLDWFETNMAKREEENRLRTARMKAGGR